MLLSIKDFAEQTGVNAVTLRAWERRYGLIQPNRTEKGHRLYSSENLDEITQILTWLNRGIPISQVKDLLDQSASYDKTVSENWQAKFDQILDAVLNRKTNSALDQICELIDEHSLSNLMEGLMIPLISKLNADFKNEHRFAIQSFFQLLNAQLLMRLHKEQLSSSRESKDCILLIALGGQTDSLATLILGTVLMEQGYDIQVSTMGIETLSFANLFDQVDPTICYMIGTHRHSVEALENLKEEEVNFLNEQPNKFEIIGAGGRIKQSQGIKIQKSWGDTDLFHFIKSSVLKQRVDDQQYQANYIGSVN